MKQENPTQSYKCKLETSYRTFQLHLVKKELKCQIMCLKKLQFEWKQSELKIWFPLRSVLFYLLGSFIIPYFYSFLFCLLLACLFLSQRINGALCVQRKRWHWGRSGGLGVTHELSVSPSQLLWRRGCRVKAGGEAPSSGWWHCQRLVLCAGQMRGDECSHCREQGHDAVCNRSAEVKRWGTLSFSSSNEKLLRNIRRFNAFT